MSHILIFCSSPFSNVICDWNNYEATKTIFCTFGCLSNHVILIATDGRGILLFCNILRYFDFVFCSSLYVCETFNHNLIGKKCYFKGGGKSQIIITTIANTHPYTQTHTFYHVMVAKKRVLPTEMVFILSRFKTVTFNLLCTDNTSRVCFHFYSL